MLAFVLFYSFDEFINNLKCNKNHSKLLKTPINNLRFFYPRFLSKLSCTHILILWQLIYKMWCFFLFMFCTFLFMYISLHVLYQNKKSNGTQKIAISKLLRMPIELYNSNKRPQIVSLFLVFFFKVKKTLAFKLNWNSQKKLCFF